ncbi:hypothetical protein QWJ41_04975 [Nocardioides sp. SOB44]|uniref:Uncharacterized protein n=1 Tax=Nocardioides cremeus TaxID=3058044 RepID=A0ABT8TPX7_9ACTN|nr:hypothetical protein [Nocardioides cremeus]MDO3395058.1 hypothetical protein [Nocardioides cremeus]
MTMRKELPDQWLWFDIDLEKVPDYEVWKPESLEWAMGVDWVKVNDLVRHNLTDYPTDDHAAAIRSGRAAGLSSADLGGLSSLYREPIYATTPQITSGGHRITAMRAQGVRWAGGQCDRDAVDDGTGEPSTRYTSTFRRRHAQRPRDTVPGQTDVRGHLSVGWTTLGR